MGGASMTPERRNGDGSPPVQEPHLPPYPPLIWPEPAVPEPEPAAPEPKPAEEPLIAEVAGTLLREDGGCWE